MALCGLYYVLNVLSLCDLFRLAGQQMFAGLHSIRLGRICRRWPETRVNMMVCGDGGCAKCGMKRVVLRTSESRSMCPC